MKLKRIVAGAIAGIMILSATTVAFALPSPIKESGRNETVIWNAYDSNYDGVVEKLEIKLINKSNPGYMTEYKSESEVPWSKYKNTIEALILHEGLVNISNYAFSNMPKLKSIGIPSTVASIGEHAFDNTPAGPHQHNEDVKIAKIEPTCTATGMTAGTKCSCGKYIVYPQTIAKTGHTPKVVRLTTASLKQNGKIEGVCTCGIVVKTENIPQIRGVKISGTKFTYNGKTQKPTFTAVDVSGKVISTKYYSIKYPTSSVNTGVYKATITYTGLYTGSQTVTYQILPSKAKVTSSNIKKTSAQIKLSTNTKQISGYQLQYSANKSFKSAKTKNVSANTKTVKLSSLKKNTTYYVRIRGYKTSGKTKLYSGWTTVSFKTKK